MSYKTKGKQISFKVEDDLAEEIERAADREDLKVADFVRKVFKYAFHKYRIAGRLWPLQQEMEEALIERQTQINRKTVRKGSHNQHETAEGDGHKKRISG